MGFGDIGRLYETLNFWEIAMLVMRYAVACCVLVASVALASGAAAEEQGKVLRHVVLFKFKDDSPAEKVKENAKANDEAAANVNGKTDDEEKTKTEKVNDCDTKAPAAELWRRVEAAADVVGVVGSPLSRVVGSNTLRIRLNIALSSDSVAWRYRRSNRKRRR